MRSGTDGRASLLDGMPREEVFASVAKAEAVAEKASAPHGP